MAAVLSTSTSPRRVRSIATHPEMVVQSDFRKVSGISTEIFNQLQAVENDHDVGTAASMEVMERRGEMVIRLLDIRNMGRMAADAARRFLSTDPNYLVRFVEVVKRPGQTLGLYIREGNGIDRLDGVFVSRIALESAVYNSGCLSVGDEILAVNFVDVTCMSLDDVVIIMSIPKRLVLTICARKQVRGALPSPALKTAEPKGPPVVVFKKDLEEEQQDDYAENGEVGYLVGPIMDDGRGELSGYPQPDDLYLYYNSQPKPKIRSHKVPGDHDLWSLEPGPTLEYQPSVIIEQPRKSRGEPHAYPKTLESLAEKVHTFHPGPRPAFGDGTLTLGRTLRRHPSATSLGMIQPCRSERSLVRKGSIQGTRPTLEPVAPRGRLMRAESDQRIFMGGPDRGYEYDSAYWTRVGRSYKGAPVTLSMQPYLDQASRTGGARYTQTLQRLSALRRRADSSCSDTEVHTASVHRGPPRPSSVTLMAAGHKKRIQEQHSSRFYSQGRSNSLPRMHMVDWQMKQQQLQQIGRHRKSRHQVRFEREPYSHDSQEESDGAVSAPELPVRRDKRRISLSPSIFTAAEYKAWISRAPSTSAIYDKLRRTPDSLPSQRATRFTYSAENLADRKAAERSHYGYRLSRGSSQSLPRPLKTDGLASSQKFRLMLDDGRPIPYPSPAKASESRVRLLDINPAEFLKYKPERLSAGTVTTSAAEESGFSGLMWVHLLGGRGLRLASRTVSSQQAQQQHYRDLYCVLECDRVHKARTVVRTGDQNFDWDEMFELDIINGKELDILIYSWDPQFRHKLCYRGAIHLAALLLVGPAHQIAVKVEPRGTLYLKLRYSNPQQAFKRTLAVRKNALFGTSMEAVVLREGAELGVPVLVKRCLEEVERRGLDIIGLYRLCGSVTKKRMLREAFERNPRYVDLSPDNVPDINVITGILKDFFRELPEPLITQCLYQMMVDALAVCLPDDPEGNAKLMFSILECLPKFNRFTLSTLMDHLKLVMSQSGRNKMTSANLATCFGPILFIQTDPTAPAAAVDFQRPIQVLKYLLDIWPSKIDTTSKGIINADGLAVKWFQAPWSPCIGTPVVTWIGERILPETAC
ncbi:hypothetical protein CHUAL_012972 [Chamberlinius hualienensis]